MKNEYILIYDSGIGGLTTFSNIIELCPKQNYIYFADTKNAPYGNKCKSELQLLILKNIKSLLKKYNIKLIVLACNTATTSSILFLRKELPIPIIGTEPNIKSPQNGNYKNIIEIN